MRKKEGMTLNELMIVVVIIVTLSGIALPRYLKSMEKARGDEALATVRLLRAAEKVYYYDNNSTYTTVADLATQGYVQNPNLNTARAFDYDVNFNNVVVPRTFTITAKRNQGCSKNETIKLDYTGIQGGTWTAQCGP